MSDSSAAGFAADAIIVGAGLAGLVAACELVERGLRVLILDQESSANLGGQAFWSFGGLFFVDSPEQRRLGIRDSHELALQDWLGTAAFDREEDYWPRQWAHAYVDFAAGEKRSWLRARGLKIFPLVGWAERGGYGAQGHGNSVPRFHITWGTGPALVEIFARRLRDRSTVRFAHRHQVDELIVEGDAVTGVRGTVLEPSAEPRGVSSSRKALGKFEFRASAVIVTSGGIGGNHDLVRKNWPKRMGRVPEQLLAGVPAHVDGRMIGISQKAGARVINPDRMWHYTEGITNYDPIWPLHGIRIIPGPSPLWLDGAGKRLPVPLYPGFDTLGTLEYISKSGYDYTWFILNAKIIEKEFALSGQEQNPDLTGQSVRQLIRSRASSGPPGPVQAFVDRGVDFVSANSLRELVTAMNQLPDVTAAGLCDGGGRGYRPRSGSRQQVQQRWSDHRDPGRPRLSRRPAWPGGGAAPARRSEGRPDDRGEAAHPDSEDAGRHRDRLGRSGTQGRRHATHRFVRGRRGGRLRRWWCARLPGAGGHFPGWLHFLRSGRGPRRRLGHHLAGGAEQTQKPPFRPEKGLLRLLARGR